jgi:GNAT superfamily N-acetyltransferase
MTDNVTIEKVDPASGAARQMMDALWTEIQQRYAFEAPNPFTASAFSGQGAGFWVAFVNNEPAGSIAISPLQKKEAELDIMYVIPRARGTGLAHALLMALETFAREQRYTAVKLRCGIPQPEALRFYEKEGFYAIPLFGKWVGDETALCFEKKI